MDRVKIDALAVIHEREGRLEPAVVVREAANPASPLHSEFTWDDSSAAHQHRLNQARGLIRCVVSVLPQISTEPIRCYVSLSSERGPGQGYVRVEDVLSDEERYRQAIADAIQTINGLQRRFGFVTEFRPLWKLVAEISAEIERKQLKLAG